MSNIEDIKKRIKDNYRIMHRLHWAWIHYFLQINDNKEDSDTRSFIKVLIKAIIDKAKIILQDCEEIKEYGELNDQLNTAEGVAKDYINKFKTNESEDLELTAIDGTLNNKNVSNTVREIAKDIIILLRMRAKYRGISEEDLELMIGVLEIVINEKKQELKEIKEKKLESDMDIESIIEILSIYEDIIITLIEHNCLLWFCERDKSRRSRNHEITFIGDHFNIYVVNEWLLEHLRRIMREGLEELSKIAPELAKELRDFISKNLEQGDSKQNIKNQKTKVSSNQGNSQVNGGEQWKKPVFTVVSENAGSHEMNPNMKRKLKSEMKVINEDLAR